MASNRRPAGQSGGSDNLFATVAADRAFPAAVAGLGRSMKKLLERIVDTFWYNLGRGPEKEFYIEDHVSRGNCQVVERLLLNNPALVHNRDGFDTPILQLAVDEHHYEMTALLLRNGCNVNASDADGATALHHAVDEEDPQIFKLLLEHGASPAIADKNGDVALDLVETSERGLLQKIIEQCAAPDGGPATASESSDGAAGPPSVS